jgi:hypothetical protein
VQALVRNLQLLRERDECRWREIASPVGITSPEQSLLRNNNGEGYIGLLALPQ